MGRKGGAVRFDFEAMLMVIFLSALMMAPPFVLSIVTGIIKPQDVEILGALLLACLVINVLLCLFHEEFWEPQPENKSARIPPDSPTRLPHRNRTRTR
jgi:hypothetical protein